MYGVTAAATAPQSTPTQPGVPTPQEQEQVAAIVRTLPPEIGTHLTHHNRLTFANLQRIIAFIRQRSAGVRPTGGAGGKERIVVHVQQRQGAQGRPEVEESAIELNHASGGWRRLTRSRPLQ